MIFKINVRGRDKIGDFWWGILCLLYLQIMIGMLPFKVFAEMALPEMDLLEMDIAEPQIPNSIIPPLSHAQLASEPVLPENLYNDEVQCVAINNVELINLDAFPNAAHLKEKAEEAHGRCLGEQGLSVLVANLQQQLVVDGYITSRVVFVGDSERDGTLMLKLMPGKIEDIRHHQDSVGNAHLSALFPGKRGDLVNLRHLEQGLENLQRLTSVNATLDVELNREDLSSQIIVNRQQSRLWRINAYLDDAGHDAVGRYRTGLILSFDNPLSRYNPLSLSDLLYFSVNRDLDSQPDKGHNSYGVHYSVPYGNWLFSMTGNQGERYQSFSFAGKRLAGKKFGYRSHWSVLDTQIQHLLTRGVNYKTVGYAGVLIRQSASFWTHREIDIQRFNTTDWQLGIEHLHYMPWATFRGGVRYQQGASWFGAQPIPGKMSTAPARLVDITSSLDIPFKIGTQSFQYRPAFSQQHTYSDISSLDKFTIGGRSSVRGFNENNALTGSRGGSLKNDISWISPIPGQTFVGQQFYIGMDYGEVSEQGQPFLLGERLAGAVVGTRGNYHAFGYDFNVGVPITKPAEFDADPLVFGFTLTWQY